jgi:hypothetical protein
MKTCICRFSELINELGLIVRAEHVEQRGLHINEVLFFLKFETNDSAYCQFVGLYESTIIVYIQIIPRDI